MSNNRATSSSSDVVAQEEEEEDDDDEKMQEGHNYNDTDNLEQTRKKEKNMMNSILGKSSVDFIAKSYASASTKTSSSSMLGNKSQVHIIPMDENTNNDITSDTKLATAVWTTSIWSPCPARSIGFAIGPFKVLYDPEYYGNEDDDEDDDDSSDESDDGKDEEINSKKKTTSSGEGQTMNQDNKDNDGEDDDDDYPTISETALIKGEGIRQLYFATNDERCHIHSQAAMISAEGLISTSYDDMLYHDNFIRTSESLKQQKKRLIMSIMGSTSGVPNRALSLMLDVLALPSYRTMSYTQIWIPNAVDGGKSCGALHSCPEVSCNPFLGGAIIDSTLLPPLGHRFPFYSGGRVLQLLQARCAIRGWINAALPLGGTDEVGYGYIHTLFEEFIMSLYEKAHGAFGEGGSRHSFFYTKRFAISSGLNSRNMDFLPVHNVEEEDLAFGIALGGLGALPAEERSNDQLWRNAGNGTESHTSALDEVSIRQLLCKDFLEGLERAGDSVPVPSVGWLGSRLCASFLSSNSTSSSGVGCGAVEQFHSVGLVYRSLKCRSLRRIIEGRVGLSNFIRVIRAAFIAATLHDKGATHVHLPTEKSSKRKISRSTSGDSKRSTIGDSMEQIKHKPTFVLCVDELIKKGGMTHGSFARTLQNISGPVRQPYLSGILVDVSRSSYDPNIAHEGFPNSFVRGASSLYLRVGAYVDAIKPGEKQGIGVSNKLHVIVEPVIPQGGISFGGPVTVRVIENGGQGQCNEYVKSIAVDGSRSDWGPIVLHGEPVSTPKQQTAASGLIESTGPSSRKKNSEKLNKKKESTGIASSLLGNDTTGDSIFSANHIHRGGYCALELIRVTNLSQFLWLRVDPQGLYDGRIALFQHDSCLAEQLFHDGEASSQVEALRALAERPLSVQIAPKIKFVYGVPVSELPVRILGDCLRGSVVHTDLPHNPSVRAQAALALAQWQNNKAPSFKDSYDWVGLKLLIQYFNERFCQHASSMMPAKYAKICVKMLNNAQSASTTSRARSSGEYQYLDLFHSNDRETVIENAIEIEQEEDEEYRVRSAVITAIASCRAKDGQSPVLVISILEKILQCQDESVTTNLVSLEESRLIEKKKKRKTVTSQQILDDNAVYSERNLRDEFKDLPYVSSSLIAETLLSLCYVNASPNVIEDPTTGKHIQSKAKHPVIPLMEACQRWLEWDLYKEDIQCEDEVVNMTGIGRNSVIAPNAITGLCSLALLRQVTTDADTDNTDKTEPSNKRKIDRVAEMIQNVTSAQYYIDIFDSTPVRADTTRAAAAQAVTCLCCAADRIPNDRDSIGLLTALEFLLERILEPTTSLALRQTLALLMLDACTGKVCLTQRVAVIGSSNDLVIGGSRLYNGPLGASYGNDSGSSLFMSASKVSLPAANAVNDGARNGMSVLRKSGKPKPNPDRPNAKKPPSEDTIVRVAKFATSLWRTMNGELGGKFNVKDGTPSAVTSAIDGVCAYDGHLRCSLLSLWQCVWPAGNGSSGNGQCLAVQRVQAERVQTEPPEWIKKGADEVMKVGEYNDEKLAAEMEDKANESLRKIINLELDRQQWRGDLAQVLKNSSNGSGSKDPIAVSQGLNQPLDIVEKNEAWKLGSWVTSAAYQRRARNEDGGAVVSATKLRLTMS